MANRIVKKVLIGIEDLLLGVGSASQERQSGTLAISKINATNLPYDATLSIASKLSSKIEVLENIAALQALNTTTELEQYVYLLGYTTAGDGGGGLFWLDTTDVVSAEDLNIIFNPDTLANGRWKRVNTDKHLSADRGDVNYAIQAFDYGIQVFATLLTDNRTVTLPVAGLYKGKKVTILRTGGGAYNLLIGAIATLTGTGLVELIYDGTTWQVLSVPTVAISSGGASLNGSFEIDSDNNGLPDDWTIIEVALATIDIDTTSSNHGVNSLKFLSGGNGGGSAVSKRFDVQSSRDIYVSFDYKSSVVDSLNKVEVRTYDISNNLVSTLPVYSEAIANPLVYTSKNAIITIDATAVTAEIVLTGIDIASTSKAAGVTTHFDNISYTPIVLLDEDDFASNSNTQAPTQQSVKAYVDATIQVVSAVDKAYQSTVLQIPLDDTIPATTEGLTLVDVTITPKYSDSRLVFDFGGLFCIHNNTDNATTVGVISLIDVTGNTTLAAGADEIQGSDGGTTIKNGLFPSMIALHHEAPSPGLVANTYRIKVGVGGSVNQTLYINGDVTNRLFGGVAECRLTVKEIR